MSLSGLVSSLCKLSLSGGRTIQGNICTAHLRLAHAQTCCGVHTSTSYNGKQKFINMGLDVTKKWGLKTVPYPKSGGRGWDGRIWTKRIGGGHKHVYRYVDNQRIGPKSGAPLIERVMKVREDPLRTGHIAIVASGNEARFILATENMKAGDLIKTSGEVKRITVQAEEGDAFPLGSLPLGTLVHNVELYPDQGGTIARAAGTTAQLMRNIGDRCIVKMPSGREINVSNTCMAVVGRVSNVDQNKEHIGSPNRMRWLGIRPRSGLWHRKTGYNGRKINHVKRTKLYDKPPVPTPSHYKLTF